MGLQNNVTTILTFSTFLLWHDLHLFRKLNKKRNLQVYTSLQNMSFSTISYLDREAIVISIFINLKEIAYVKPKYYTKIY